MKRKSKIVLLIIAAVMVLTGATCGIVFAVNASTEKINGTVFRNNVETGTGIEDWVKYDVDIAVTSPIDTARYYTNKSGDYLTDINLHHESYLVMISYRDYFNLFDDFDSFFVLSNMKEENEEIHYVTDIETDHIAGKTTINIDFDVLDANFFNRKVKNYDIINSFHIIEIWVRTDD